MSKRIGNLFATLGLDTGGFSKGIKDADRSISQFERGIKNTWKSISSVVSSPLIGLAGAAGFTAFISNAMQSAVELGRTADAIGISTEKLGAFQFELSKSGIAAQEVSRWMLYMNKNIGLAAMGTGEAAAALKGLGLSAENLVNLSADQQLYKISDALKKMGDSGYRTGIITKIFGENSQQVTRFLVSGSAAMENQVEVAQKLGLTLTEIDVSKINQAYGSFQELKSIFTVIGNQLAVVLAPAISGFSKYLLNAANGADGLKIRLQAIFKTIVGGLPYVSEVGNAFNLMIKGLGFGISGISYLVVGAFSTIYNSMAWMEGATIISFNRMSDQISEIFYTMEAGILQGFQDTLKGFGMSGLFPGLDKAIKDAGRQADLAWQDNMSQMFKNPIDVAESFFNMEGFSASLKGAREELFDLTASFQASVKAGANAFMDPEKSARSLDAWLNKVNTDFDELARKLLKGEVGKPASGNQPGGNTAVSNAQKNFNEVMKWQEQELEEKWKMADAQIDIWNKEEKESKSHWDKLVEDVNGWKAEYNKALNEMDAKTSQFAEDAKFYIESWKDSTVDAFVDMEMGISGSFKKLLGSIAQDILKMTTKLALFGSNGTGGMLGSLFGSLGGMLGKSAGGRASGGPMNAGSPYIVGERGPELVIPRSNSMVIPNRALAMAGGGQVIVNQTLNFGEGFELVAKQAIMNMLPQIRETTVAGVRDAQRRNGGKL